LANGAQQFVCQLHKSPYAVDYHGIYTVRNPASAHEIHRSPTSPPGHTFETQALDLGSLEKIRAAAKYINDRVANGALEPIRALTLNAAFQDANAESPTPKTYTNDGYEAPFAINSLENFLLVLLILQSIDKGHGQNCDDLKLYARCLFAQKHELLQRRKAQDHVH